MAQGIEVLQAAFAGKRLGYRRPDGVIAWYEPAEFLGNFVGLDVIRKEWQIAEPTLTFTDAVAAMDAGQIVTKGDGATKYRWEGSDYWYCTDGDQEWFPDAVFGWEEIHATDWRIVREALVQGVNVPDLTMFIREKSEWRLPPSVAEEMAEALLQRWVLSAKDDNTPEG